MSEQTFNEPRIALNRIYTRTGDAGQTHLVGGQRISKDDLRIDCYGTVDELNAFIGAARATSEELSGRVEQLRAFSAVLKRVQHELFNLGSILATLPEDVHPKQPRVTSADVQQLEHEIDEANSDLKPLRSFVLPGGSRLDAELHICRTVCRRAERLLVSLAKQQDVPPEALRYLNRLSDALFVWSRWVNHVAGATETLWEPNAAGERRRGKFAERHRERLIDAAGYGNRRGGQRPLERPDRQLPRLDTRRIRFFSGRVLPHRHRPRISSDDDRNVAFSITLTLAFRPVGAFLFGLIADRYGRRLPLMIDLNLLLNRRSRHWICAQLHHVSDLARAVRNRYGRRVGCRRFARHGKSSCKMARRAVRLSAAGIRAGKLVGSALLSLPFR